MSAIGEPPESWMSRFFRYIGYFIVGAFVGLLPGAFLVAATSARHIAWKIPVLIVFGFGAVFCLLGIVTRGSFLTWLFGLFGRHIDPP
jgi:hypothetical protein